MVQDTGSSYKARNAHRKQKRLERRNRGVLTPAYLGRCHKFCEACTRVERVSPCFQHRLHRQKATKAECLCRRHFQHAAKVPHFCQPELAGKQSRSKEEEEEFVSAMQAATAAYVQWPKTMDDIRSNFEVMREFKQRTGRSFKSWEIPTCQTPTAECAHEEERQATDVFQMYSTSASVRSVTSEDNPWGPMLDGHTWSSHRETLASQTSACSAPARLQTAPELDPVRIAGTLDSSDQQSDAQPKVTNEESVQWPMTMHDIRHNAHIRQISLESRGRPESSSSDDRWSTAGDAGDFYPTQVPSFARAIEIPDESRIGQHMADYFLPLERKSWIGEPSKSRAQYLIRAEVQRQFICRLQRSHPRSRRTVCQLCGNYTRDLLYCRCCKAEVCETYCADEFQCCTNCVESMRRIETREFDEWVRYTIRKAQEPGAAEPSLHIKSSKCPTGGWRTFAQSAAGQ